MDALTVFRVVLPVIGIVIFVLVGTLTRAPRYVTYLVLEVCWVAGLIGVVAYTLANVFHIWHYTLSPLYYGLPIDFYVTVSLVYGGAVSLIYWRISHSKYKAFALYFVIALPFYGLVRDFFGQRVSGTTFLVWDHLLWWIADFIAWAAGLWTTILVFHLKIRHAEWGTRRRIPNGKPMRRFRINNNKERQKRCLPVCPVTNHRFVRNRRSTLRDYDRGNS